MVKLKFLGGSEEVGRSGFLLDAGTKILLDYGIKLERTGIEYPLPVDTNLDAIVISHAHLDHSGHLPHLFQGSKSLAFMTPPTLELSEMLWQDSLKIARIEGNEAPFSRIEIQKTEKYTFPTNYGKKMDISEDVSLEMFDAGHILGSAMTKINMGNKTLVYTGDFKLIETRLHAGADVKALGKVDYLITESTYGDREQPDRKALEKRFIEEIQDAIDKGGHVLIAAFAVGRSCEIIDILNEYKLNADIYLDGLAQKAANIYLNNPKFLKNPKFLTKALGRANWVRNRKMRQQAIKEPCIIVTTSGMVEGGPVYEYLPKLYKDKNSKLFLTGYQVEGTGGRKLLETGKITIDGNELDVKMGVEKFEFSAHASRTELFKTIEKVDPKKVICVHGDVNTIQDFQKDIEGHGYEAIVARRGEEVEL